MGGRVSHHLTGVEVSCLPKNLPEYIEVDMTELEIGQSIHLSELILPQGVEIPALAQTQVAGQDQVVVMIHAPYAEEEETKQEGEEDETSSEE